MQTPQWWAEISCEDGPRPDRSGKSFMNEGNRLSASPSLPLTSLHLGTNSHGLPGLGGAWQPCFLPFPEDAGGTPYQSASLLLAL